MSAGSMMALRATPRRGAALGAAARLAGRLTRSGLVLAAAAAGLSAVVVWQYHAMDAGSVDLASLQLLAANPAIRVLFGTPIGLNTAGGFTVWRMGTPLAVMLSVWTILAITRVTRGDEELGRWELLSAARSSRSALTGVFLAVVAASAVLVGIGVATAMIITGAGVSGSVLYGAGLALVGVSAAGVGALAAQLATRRRHAIMLAVGLVVIGQAMRMVGDGLDHWGWLGWATPYGLLTLIEPFAVARTAPLLVLGGMAVTCCLTAVWAAGRRDHLAGLVAATDRTRYRPMLLRSPALFLVRRHAGTTVAWLAGVAAYFVLIGALSGSVTEFMDDAPQFARLAAEAGFRGLGTIEGYLAALFTVLTLPVGLLAVTMIGSFAADEASGRMTLMFSTPVSRRRWYAEIWAVGALAGTVLALTAALATMIGSALAAAPPSWAAVLAASLNTVPLLIVSLGTSAAALGWWPRAVALGAVPTVGGFVWFTLVDTFGWPAWLAALTPYAHLAAVPVEQPDWAGASVMVMSGLLLTAVGLVGYRRRDLRG